MPFKFFEPGETFFAADVQEFIMDQALFIFSSASVRDAVFASAGAPYPLEGMIAYTGSGSAQFYDGASWQEWPTSA
jgi:hypothetical protein